MLTSQRDCDRATCAMLTNQRDFYGSLTNQRGCCRHSVRGWLGGVEPGVGVLQDVRHGAADPGTPVAHRGRGSRSG